MISYSIHKAEEEKKIIKKKKLNIEGYQINPKWSNKEDLIKVNSITITSETLKQNFLHKQFAVAYKKLFRKILATLEGDSSSDTLLSLDEIEKNKRILKDKYQKLLSLKEYENMLKKIELLESKLKEKFILQKNIELYLEQEQIEETKGRGR